MNKKQTIIKTVNTFSEKNLEHIKIIDRIYRLLISDQIEERIYNGLSKTLKNEYISVESKNILMNDVVNRIAMLDAGYDELSYFLDKLEEGTVINVDEISKKINSLSNVLNNDPMAIKVFDLLKSYGIGKFQKGPCEFALALLSKHIRLAKNEGDIEIDGVGLVEVKAAINENGGRLGHRMEVSQKNQMEIIEKHKDKIPLIYDKLKTNVGGSIGINKFVEILNQDLPPTNQKNMDLREELTYDLLVTSFDDFAREIAISFRQEDQTKIVDEYAKQNFEWYKDHDKFDACLVIGVKRNKTMLGVTGEDIVDMHKKGHIIGYSISMIPSRAGARESFIQLSPSSIEFV